MPLEPEISKFAEKLRGVETKEDKNDRGTLLYMIILNFLIIGLMAEINPMQQRICSPREGITPICSWVRPRFSRSAREKATVSATDPKKPATGVKLRSPIPRAPKIPTAMLRRMAAVTKRGRPLNCGVTTRKSS